MIKDKTIQYKIILTKNKISINQLKHFYYFRPAEDEFNKIVESNNKNILFPKEFTNQGGNNGGIQSLSYEILLLKRKSNENEIGLSKNIIVDDSSEFVIIKKETLLVEEDFHIFGLNPHNQRKDIRYVLSDLLTTDIVKSTLDVIIIQNKIILFGDKYDDVKIIICKNKKDSYRLYNVLHKIINNEPKYKNISKRISFIGYINRLTIKEELYTRVMKTTGWNRRKLLRDSSRP